MPRGFNVKASQDEKMDGRMNEPSSERASKRTTTTTNTEKQHQQPKAYQKLLTTKPRRWIFQPRTEPLLTEAFRVW